MKRIRVDELRIGDCIALSDGSAIVGQTVVTAIERIDPMPDLPAYLFLTLDGKRKVMQRVDDHVNIMDAKMEMRKDEE